MILILNQLPILSFAYLSYLEELFCELWPIILNSFAMFPFMENELLGRFCWGFAEEYIRRALLIPHQCCAHITLI